MMGGVMYGSLLLRLEDCFAITNSLTTDRVISISNRKHNTNGAARNDVSDRPPPLSFTSLRTEARECAYA